MLRLLHTADVHLGPRHADLGERAAALRERQAAAFAATIDLAVAEKVDVVLVAGDLFDSNAQPRRSVERVAAQLKRLVEARIRCVLIPGTHDVYDPGSIYRTFDLIAMAGAVGSDLVSILTPDRTSVYMPTLDLIVHGVCFPTKRAPRSPLADFDASEDKRARWHVGLLHASVAIPDRTDQDEVVITPDEIAASHLDYLALGHWHSTLQQKAGRTVWAYAGAPEPVAVDQDRAGNVLLVTLKDRDRHKHVTVEPRKVGRTTFERIEMDAGEIASQPWLIERLGQRADPDLVLDVRVVGVRPDQLDLQTDEVESALADRFLRVRVRDRSVAALPDDGTPPADTVLGALVRDLEDRIAELEAADDPAASEVRDALRLARLLLGREEVTL
jgi:exonuclease SbcD